jgi:HSP20 family protein
MRRVSSAHPSIRTGSKEIAMNLIRWEPFASLESMIGRMPSLPRWSGFPDFDGETRFAWSPSADISETEQEYLIRAELPAVRKEDVHVTFEDGMLTISVERRHKEEEKKEKFHRVESFYGSFRRSFTLPQNADATAIRAESRDGVITIHVPKAKSATKKAKEIQVQ